VARIAKFNTVTITGEVLRPSGSGDEIVLEAWQYGKDIPKKEEISTKLLQQYLDNCTLLRAESV
jgi:hypothetical protein